MAGRLSFSVAINLLTENFKKGASSVQQGLKSMQMQVLTFAAAIGAGGIGLGNFVSKLIETARETSKVTTALKNVSVGAGGFAESQRFLIGLANKYGLEINSLTGAFAKFTATATNAGMTMTEQQKLFESVSRATTAFGLSSDEANGVFLALSQMMSKGKVSAEELRGQMGERLPIAMQAMAKAAGTTVGGLDDLMKQGKLLSSEVLPKFADALNSMTPNVNTDNIETSMNRLKNAFTDFTKGTGVQSAFKSMIDNLTSIVGYAGENIKSVVSSVVAFIVGVSLGRMFKWIATEIAKAQRAAMIAASNAARAAGQAFDAAAWRAQSGAATMSMAFARAGKAIKAALISALPTAIFVAIAELIAKGISLYTEYNRIKNLFSDYKAEVQGITHTPEIIQLQVLKKIAEDTGRSYQERKGAIDKINSLLGTSYVLDKNSLTIQGDINKKIAERVELLKAGAEVDYFTRKKLETEDKLRAAETKAADRLKVGGNFNPWNGPTGLKTIWSLVGFKTGIDSPISEVQELRKILNDINTRLEASTAKIGNSGSTTTTTVIPKATTTTSGKVEASKIELTEMQKIEAGYADSLRKLTNQKDAELIDSKTYEEKFQELINSTMLLAASQLGADAKTNTFYKDLLGKKAPAAVAPIVSAPALKGRDKTFDYKKSKSDMIGEDLDVAKENLESIKKLYDAGATNLVNELNSAMDKVTTLEDALKIAQVKQDVQDFQKQLNNGVYSGVKDVASSADRMVSSFSSLRDVFSDVDSSGWERIMAVWNAMTNTVDSFLSILEMIENLTELTNRLADAKKEEVKVDTTTTAIKVSNAATGAVADTVAAGVKATTATTEIGANTAVAASEAGKSAAKLPFPLNLIAVAGAIGSVLTLFSNIPKFENGGIVGGTSYTGDKILTRLNSGEMVLNKSQQNIVGAAISKNSGTNVTIGGHVRGADIYLALKNYQNQTGKKL